MIMTFSSVIPVCLYFGYYLQILASRMATELAITKLKERLRGGYALDFQVRFCLPRSIPLSDP